MIQWLRRHGASAGGPGSVPGQGTDPECLAQDLMQPNKINKLLKTFLLFKLRNQIDFHSLGLGCVTQSYLTLGDPMDCSPPGCSVHGIFLVRILESVAFSSSRGYFQPRD